MPIFEMAGLLNSAEAQAEAFVKGNPKFTEVASQVPTVSTHSYIFGLNTQLFSFFRSLMVCH
jgi:hypothetical protein